MKTKIILSKMLKLILVVVIGITSMTLSYAVDNKIRTNFASSVVRDNATHNKEIIVLIHGLMRSYMSMRPLKNYLESHGYQVYYYSYASEKYTIHEHANDLNQAIETLLAENPNTKVHFITHSLGGIIIREALSELSKQQMKNIGSLIMLAPPNQGSILAKLSTEMFPMLTYGIKPLAELSSDEQSYVHHVPVPDIKMGIIAGRFDMKVPPSAAYLEGQNPPVVINATHTFIMNHTKTRELILSFLKQGSF